MRETSGAGPSFTEAKKKAKNIMRTMTCFVSLSSYSSDGLAAEGASSMRSGVTISLERAFLVAMILIYGMMLPITCTAYFKQ